VVGIAEPRQRAVTGRVLLLAVAGVALYIVFPSLVEVLEAWPRLADIAPGWFALMLAAEITSFAAVWYLQRIAFRDSGWFDLITSQLASNAFSRIVPGGAAAGGALQFRMLSASGADPAAAATSLTALSLITTASLFVLPVLSIPAIAAGMPVPDGIIQAAWIGAGLFLALGILTVVLARSSKLLMKLGNLIERFRPTKSGLETWPTRLVRERDDVLQAIGRRWPLAAGASVAKWLFDFYALLAALVAVGDDSRISLVLLAYVAGAVLSMVPITPGGLGFVEAGLTATLTASGVSPGRAVLATLAYRLVSYWLPLVAGMFAYVWWKVRQNGSSVDQ
jgi:uncharacterized protein (TIRG00374 family)